MSYSSPSYPPLQYNPSSTSSTRPSWTSSTTNSTDRKLARDASVLIQTYLPPDELKEAPPYRPDDVPQVLPLCIPRVATAFARGYNPELETVGITQAMFLSFIDGLNLAIVASPPLRVVDVVGQVIGLL